jgi:hypothetical protein
MRTTSLPTIWELLGEAAATLPEPFSRAALINWVSARRPDVGAASIASHIQFATDNAGGHASGPFADRTPLLHRVDRGRYLRYRPEGEQNRALEHPSSGRVVLIGSSGVTASTPRPAAELFESPGFVAARTRAVRSGARWFVLSARHGLLHPDDVATPSDDLLGDHTLGYRIAWGEWVAAQLAERMWLTGVVVEVHGGVDFAQPLRQPLGRRGAGVEIPLPRMWEEEPDDSDRDTPADRGMEDDRSPARAAFGRLRELVVRHRPPEFDSGHDASAG